MKSLTLTLSPRTAERGAKGSAGVATADTTRSRLADSASPSKMRLRTGKAFWAGKMAANMARDRFVSRALRRRGWKVVRIWEHELGKSGKGCVGRIRAALDR